MADFVTSSDLKSALDQGFDDIYKKLTHHFDIRFDDLKNDIADLNTKYDQLVTTLDAFLKDSTI